MSTFLISGAADLDRKLKALSKPLEDKAVRASLRHALQAPLAVARANVPRGSVAHRTYRGRLVAPGFAARSLRIAVGKPRNGSVRARLGVRAEAFYALQFIELGTRYIARRPWLAPAMRATKEQQVERYQTALRKWINRAIKRGLA
jgi:HK97 gp10 family phage protein